MRVLKEIFVVLLVIISFLLLSTYITLANTSMIISKENMKNISNDLKINSLIDEDTKKELNSSLVKYGLSENYLDKILNNNELKEEVFDILSDTINSFLEDGTIPDINSNKLNIALNNCIDIVVNEARNDGVKINEKEIKSIKQEITNNIDEVTAEINKVKDEFTKSLEEDAEMRNINYFITSTRKVYSNKYWYLIGALVCIMIAVLLKIKEFKFIGLLKNIGIVFGIIYLIFGGLFNIIFKLLSSTIPEVATLLNASLAIISKTYFITGIVLFIIGIILAIVYKIIKKNLLISESV